MLVLGLLGNSESYGYELVTRLQAAGLTGIATGTVYPVLSRLEREGLLTCRLQESPAGPARKYYTPTSQGRSHFATALAAWAELGRVVTALTPGKEGQ